MKKRSNISQLVFIVIISILLSGCLKGEQTLGEMDSEVENDPDELNEAETIDDPTEKESDSEEIEDTEGEKGEIVGVNVDELVDRQLYLIDSDGMVVPQTLSIPADDSKAVAKQVLTYLIKDGPVTELLPNGFQAVLPANTEILGLNLLEDGTLIVDVSEDFKNYEADEELSIIQAMTHTLTQFDNIDRLQLRINGEDQSEMPVNGTPISEGYSQNNGINLMIEEQPDLLHSKAVTVFYPKRHNSNIYFVPMTQYIKDLEGNLYDTIVQALIDGPSHNVQALQVFNDGTSLVNKPTLNDGVLQLEFNENILKEVEKSIISDEVMETLARTFTIQDDIDAIDVKVENKDVIMNENGNAYNKPVMAKHFEQADEI